jgi:hypothetical protein
MNFKKTFLKLTEWTYPFGSESELEPLLPSGWKKDSIGNYYYQIGNSNTLFTSHLDVASDKKEKVNHVVEGDIIKTDGSTILGGDNKAGCCILFYLINNNVPGTYYFFLGEESAVHKNYPFGSLMAIDKNPDFFKKFKRAIAFDRKQTGELITRQLGYNCCSDEFADSLIIEFKSQGVDYKKDRTGYYTDSAFFGGLIPEITNLSCGVWNEHTKNEYVDISYIRKVAQAASKIDWENLPTIRKVNTNLTDPRSDDELNETSTDGELFRDLFHVLDELYFVCREIRNYKNFLNHFQPGRKYHFTEWHGDIEFVIEVQDGIIKLNDGKNNYQFQTIDDFKKFLGIEKLPREDFFNLIFNQFKKSSNRLSIAEFDNLVYLKGGSVKKLRKDLLRKGYKLNRIGKGYEITKESTIYIKLFKKFTGK